MSKSRLSWCTAVVISMICLWVVRCSHRSKMNLSSISSMSMISDEIGSWVTLIRRCSIFTTSRCNEFSSRSSKAINSGICILMSKSYKGLAHHFHLRIFFGRECPNDEVASLWHLVNNGTLKQQLLLLPVSCLYISASIRGIPKQTWDRPWQPMRRSKLVRVENVTASHSGLA